MLHPSPCFPPCHAPSLTLLSCSYVDNVAAAHVQALAALLKGGVSSPLAGQAYFIGSSFSSSDLPRFSYGQFNGLSQSEGETSKLDHWGHPPPRLLPLPLVNALARANEALFGESSLCLFWPACCGFIILLSVIVLVGS
jgi:hypothetical protein